MASNLPAGRARAARPLCMIRRGRWLVAPCWAVRPRAACVSARAALWDLAIYLQYVTEGSGLLQGLLEAIEPGV